MDLSKISSNFELETNLKHPEEQTEQTTQEPDKGSIFAEFKENGNGTVDIDDIVCAEGTTLSNKIMKFLTDNKGKKWTPNLAFDLNRLLNEFNLEKFKEEALNNMKTFMNQDLNEQETLVQEGVTGDDFADAMAEPWTKYEVHQAEEAPVKGPDKPPVYGEDTEDDEEEGMTLYEPESTPPPIGNKPKVQPDASVQDKQPIDTSKPGAKWSEKSVVSGSGFYSKKTATYERLDDMTIRKTEVEPFGRKGVVLHSRYQEDGKTLISKEYITTIGGTRVLASAQYDENGQKISDTYDLDTMKEPSCYTSTHNLSSEISKSQNCSIELQDKDGNIILSVKDGQVLNGKGKPIHKDLYDFLEKYENTEGLKLIKRY